MQIPIVSYSSLDCYAKCPFSYYLKYVIRESQGEADYTGTVPGNVAHKLAENMFKHKDATGVLDFGIFEREFDSVFYKYAKGHNVYFNKDSFAPNIEQARTKVKDWADNLCGMIQTSKLAEQYTISEFRFGHHKNPLAITPKLLFTGGPDLFSSVSRDTPGVLVDYKATDSSFHLNEKQLFLYAIALKVALNVDVSMVAFFLFKSREIVWKGVNRNKVDETIAWAEFIVDQIVAERFEPTPSKTACNLCPFKLSCPSSSCFIPKQSSIKSIRELTNDVINFDLGTAPEM